MPFTICAPGESEFLFFLLENAIALNVMSGFVTSDLIPLKVSYFLVRVTAIDSFLRAVSFFL